MYSSDRSLITGEKALCLLWAVLLVLLTCCSRSGDLNSLIEKMKDENTSVRWQASLGLVEIGEPAVEPLISLLKDRNPDARLAAVNALGDIKDTRAVGPLAAALKDSEPDVRAAAALALGQIKDPGSVGPLISAIKDSDPDVRESAVQALGQIKDPSASEPLRAALNDSDPYVREEAAMALQEITGGSHVKNAGVLLHDRKAVK